MMKNATLSFAILFTAFTTALYAQNGFNSITSLDDISIGTSNTGESPQSKVWQYANQHWTVLSTLKGTYLFRLDGTSWKSAFKISTTSTGKADIKVVGDVVHIFMWKNTTSNYLYSLQYDAASNNYKFWSVRSKKTSVPLDGGVHCATIDIDGNGRMWLASDEISNMYVRYSDYPYSKFSSRIKIASSTTDADLCGVVAMPALNKIGVFWSNKSQKKFGFVTHNDGSSSTSWSSDEAPGASSAANVGGGFADADFNLGVTQNGTVYAAFKTSYNNNSYLQLGLMIRQPNGNWSDPYPVTYNEGSSPLVTINESLNKLRIVYTLSSGIYCKVSTLSNISFGSADILIGGSYDNATSIKGSYGSELVILASKPLVATGILGIDGTGTPPPNDQTPPTVSSINRQSPSGSTTSATAVTFRTTFSEAVTGVDAPDFALTTTGGVTGTVSAVSPVSPAVYDVTVSSISNSGTLRLDLKSTGTGIKDIAGNAITNGFTAGQTYTIDQTVTTLTAVNIASNNSNTSLAKSGNIVSVSFTASALITSISVRIATHAVTASSTGGNSYKASYTMTSSDAQGLIPFSIDYSSSAGTAAPQVTSTTDGSSVTYDRSAPTVSSINRQSPSSNPTSATTVTFRATFSEDVSGVDPTDFSLTTGSTATGSISNVSVVSASVYDVTVSSVGGNGTLRVDLKSSGTGITDPAGNAISGGYTSGQTYTIQQAVSQAGFTSVTPLSDIPISIATKDKPQAKAWTYANKWWCVLSSTSGTALYRLDGTTWTKALTLTSGTGKPDCLLAGNLVHVLIYRGQDKPSYFYTVEFDVANTNYKLWSVRPSKVDIVFPSPSETANLTLDGNGRLWVASAVANSVQVWWSDAPYSTWSTPYTLATGITSDDICAITPLPALGKIGVIWANQNTRRYGFRTHSDGSSPTSWTSDELPASQSAIDNIGAGMADDHLNTAVATDGTLYVAAKTGYNKTGYAKLILLVRRPSGSWDDAHTVTMNPEGTQPNVVLNEALGRLRIVYATVENGGDIVYRESSTSNISFGPSFTLFQSSGRIYDYATSTHQTCNSEVVIIATDLTASPLVAVSVLAKDGAGASSITSTSSVSTESVALAPAKSETGLKASPNPFNGNTTISFALETAGNYSLDLYNSNGSKQSVLKKGWSEAGILNQARIDGAKLSAGLYLVKLQTDKKTEVIKVMMVR